jgi:8-oxo-dGTP pyrophosphatase MutT (NUDIX family)
MSFAESYLGKLRSLVGNQLLLVPGARIVIEAPDGRILLEQRADFRLWGVPGGSAEPGESLSETIVREVREETGLELGRVTAFGFASDPLVESIAFPNGDVCQYFSLPYTSRDFQGKPDR